MPKKVKTKFAVLAASIQGKLEKAKRATALEVLKNVVFLTPVDTGRARANWFVGVGGPNTERKDTNPGAKGNQGFAGSFEQGKRKILTTPAIGQDIYLSNNLPYISKLNEGSSDQQPAGFVERAIQAGVNTIRGLSF